MRGHEVFHFKSAEDLTKEVAARLIEEVRLAQRRRDSFHLALSGGRIAPLLYQSLVEQLRGSGRLFRPVHFFWADERCVPPADAESNFRLAREHLLEPLQVEVARIHRIRSEAEPTMGAMDAQADLVQTVGRDRFGRPILDLVILGMGEDGHVASLFPGEKEQPKLSKLSIYRPVIAPKPPPNRITLNYEAIAAAVRVWVLIAGSGKERAFAESISPEGITPLARVVGSRRRTELFTTMQPASPDNSREQF